MKARYIETKDNVFKHLKANQELYEGLNQMIDMLEKCGEIAYKLQSRGEELIIEVIDHKERDVEIDVHDTIEKIQDAVYDKMSYLINQSKQLHVKYNKLKQ